MKAQSKNTLELLQTRPGSGALGVVIEGLDIGNLSPDQAAAVRAALDEHSVLVFPDQELTPAQQIEFTSHFGPVAQHPLYRSAIL
ncbi:MAG: taurine dioxygenase, partial [Parasphingorhabdus sp.]